MISVGKTWLASKILEMLYECLLYQLCEWQLDPMLEAKAHIYLTLSPPGYPKEPIQEQNWLDPFLRFF